MKEYRFEALIKSSEIGKGGAYIEFPFNVEKEFGGKGRIKVMCFFDDIEYRGSLVKMGTQCHIIGISKDIRSKIGKNVGDKVEVRLRQDENERAVQLHPALVKEFQKNEALKDCYEMLSYTKKKEINVSLSSAKKEETLENRLEKILEELKGR
jgi:hypothetical protein